jgi:hypothetical protein
MLTLTSPTSGGRSVGIVRSRIQATEFSFRLEDGGTLFLRNVSNHLEVCTVSQSGNCVIKQLGPTSQRSVSRSQTRPCAWTASTGVRFPAVAMFASPQNTDSFGPTLRPTRIADPCAHYGGRSVNLATLFHSVQRFQKKWSCSYTSAYAFTITTETNSVATAQLTLTIICHNICTVSLQDVILLGWYLLTRGKLSMC